MVRDSESRKGKELTLNEFREALPNKRMEEFCQSVAVRKPIVEAYTGAGYSEKGAVRGAQRMLQRDDVRLRIVAIQQMTPGNINLSDLIEELKCIAFSDITDFITWGDNYDDGELTPDEAFGMDSDDPEDGPPPRPTVDAWLRLRAVNKINGKVIRSLKIGSDGAFTIQLHDKQAAIRSLMQLHKLQPADENDPQGKGPEGMPDDVLKQIQEERVQVRTILQETTTSKRTITS